MKTVLMHFYNEEYLLPWWLEHHKKYFDHGILIDYASTDNSVAICKEICPNWQVVSSRNIEFDAGLCDEEVVFYEQQIEGWRIALTTTEFLIGNLDKLTVDIPARSDWHIPGVMFTAWDPEGSLDKNKPLWEQLKMGIPYTVNPHAHRPRSLHNFKDPQYELGRHVLGSRYNTEDVVIFHYAYCIVGEPMIKRRLQIQTKVSLRDKQHGLGTNHWHNMETGLTHTNMEELHKTKIAVGAIDCSDIIKRLT